ncbi:flagellar biosynthetic protein FliO [Candidatus Endobugula sertula]|uniref:Flagellar protein n=1 Tax=Candidatus Endobugula sertula TaxID=62101 RepID=A0A1D2QN49_9GAMM|nr:flagellar biosynthetic protein FliO [Candidatus Endobugula sertula]
MNNILRYFMVFYYILIGLLLLFSVYVNAENRPSSSIVESTHVQYTLPNHATSLIEVFLSLIFVVILIFLLAWFIKRAGYSGVHINSSMKIKSCLPLSTKEKILIVEIGDEQMVIAVAPGFVGLIKSLEKPIDFNEEGVTPSFLLSLSQIIKRNESQ